MKQRTLDFLNKVVDGMIRAAEEIRTDTDEVVAANNHVDIIKHFNDARIAAEIIKDAKKALDNIVDTLSRVVIPDVVAKLKETTGEKPPFVIEGVGRVSVSYRFSCSMIDKDQGIDWLRGSGNESLVTETVNSSTLAAFAKDMLENQGKELPSEIFKVSTSPFTSITKAR